MGFAAYLRSHVHLILVEAVTCLLVWGVLGLMGLPAAEGCLAFVLLTCGLGLALLVDWLLAREFLSDVADLGAAGEEALLVASELRDPGSPAGHLVWQAVDAVTLEAQRRIGELRTREGDYHHYVEAWVHEIKTPLAALDLMLDNLQGVSTHPLHRELDKVSAYVEQALYYARSSAVEKDFAVRPCDLREPVRAAVRSRASELIGCSVSVDLSGLEGRDCRVMADQKWVTFILGQLVENAVHYRVEDEGRSCRISFSARERRARDGRREVLLDVRDNGRGIPASDISRVFDKGFTGENGRTYRKSTGLGLYLVRTMCDKMGVGIVATSLPGSWTCFTLAFPSAGPTTALREVGPLG